MLTDLERLTDTPRYNFNKLLGDISKSDVYKDNLEVGGDFTSPYSKVFSTSIELGKNISFLLISQGNFLFKKRKNQERETDLNFLARWRRTKKPYQVIAKKGPLNLPFEGKQAKEIYQAMEKRYNSQGPRGLMFM